jgi:CRISPR-associated endoribonuclease Cas6
VLNEYSTADGGILDSAPIEVCAPSSLAASETVLWRVDITLDARVMLRPQWLHAFCAALLDDADDIDANGPKTYGPGLASLSLHGSGRWSAEAVEGERTVVRIGGVGLALRGRLVERAVLGTEIRVGPAEAARTARIAGMVLGRAERASVFAGGGQTRVRVRFRTPTTFRRGRRYYPWPDPSVILRSTSERWESLVGPKQASELVEAFRASRAGVLEARITTETRYLYGEPVAGCVGEIEYGAPDPDGLAGLVACVRIGEFLGLGSRTEYGFGAITLLSGGRAAHAITRSRG